MRDEHDIVSWVQEAQDDPQSADALIRQYLPFIRSETAKFLKRPPMDGDDELSIAMLAFYEAVMGYQAGRGSFLRLAATGIRNRLIDYYRQERRHRGQLSLEQPVEDEDGPTLLERTDTGRDEIAEITERSLAKAEIREFGQQLSDFGLSLSDVAASCPRQKRTLAACLRALEYAKANPDLLDSLVRSRKLPIAQLAEGAGVDRKTLERHRKYLVAILLAYTNGYEIIRGHLRQINGKEGTRA